MHARQSLEYTGPRLENQKLLALTMPSWVEKTKQNNNSKVNNNNDKVNNVSLKKTKTFENHTVSNTSKKSNPLTFLTA